MSSPVCERAIVVPLTLRRYTAGPVGTSTRAAKGDVRCAWIDKAIESIDAQARQGQAAVIQDRLREDRQKLVDERYALKC